MDGKNLSRSAFHAGTWYSDDSKILESDIQTYFSKTDKLNISSNSKIKSLIVPHAGYKWSGPTAAWGYVNIDPNLYNRVVILGPSHHSYILGLGLTQCNVYETPFGNISIDTESISKLSSIKGFEMIDLDVDEKEHSLEMQLPFIKYIFKDLNLKLLPIIVGQTDLKLDKYFAEILLEFFNDSQTLFIISSDFCHWGSRFRFTYHDPNNEYIYESIEYLDKLAIKSIENLSVDEFHKYLSEFKNTICGRRPISILLSIIQEADNIKSNYNKIKFIKYDQSDKVKSSSGSSVSYAVGLNIQN